MTPTPTPTRKRNITRRSPMMKTPTTTSISASLAATEEILAMDSSSDNLVTMARVGERSMDPEVAVADTAVRAMERAGVKSMGLVVDMEVEEDTDRTNAKNMDPVVEVDMDRSAKAMVRVGVMSTALGVDMDSVMRV